MKKVVLMATTILLLSVICLHVLANGPFVTVKASEPSLEEKKDQILEAVEEAKKSKEISDKLYKTLKEGVEAAGTLKDLTQFLSKEWKHVSLTSALANRLIGICVDILEEGPCPWICIIIAKLRTLMVEAATEGDWEEYERLDKLRRKYIAAHDKYCRPKRNDGSEGGNMTLNTEPIDSVPAARTLLISEAEANEVDIELPLLLCGGKQTASFEPNGIVVAILEPTDDVEIASLVIVNISLLMTSFEIPYMGSTGKNFITLDLESPFSGLFSLRNETYGEFWAGGSAMVTNDFFTVANPITFSGFITGKLLQNGTAIVGLYGIDSYPLPFGGITNPVDKFDLLAPYIGLASTILFAVVAAAIYSKHVKRKRENQ